MRKDCQVKHIIHSVERKIELVRVSLRFEKIGDKALREKISLLSALLDIKKKLRLELKELESEGRKPKEELSDILELS